MAHALGTLTIEIHFPDVHSLKEKRSILKGLLVKTRQRFNVSVAEVDYQDLWQRALVGVAVISANSVEADKSLEAVANFVESNLEMGMVIDVRKEVL